MNFHGGQIKKEGMLDFSVNIPSIPYEVSYKNLLIQTIEKLYDYPEIDGFEARKSLSDYLDWPAEQIVLGNGATDLIYMITRALKFSKAMILQPTFTEYQRALNLSGVECINYILKEEDLFQLTPSRLSNAINDSKCDVLFMCNPNNPTGQLFDADLIEDVLRQVKSEKFLLVIDESFIEFKFRPDYVESIKTLMNRYNILIIRSMTKTFCVPGLRIGYCFANKETINQINQFRDPWALNRFALESIPYFMSHLDHLVALQSWCCEESLYLKSALSQIDYITGYASEANFILIKIKHPNPMNWHEKLFSKGIYLRTCTDFIGLDAFYFRIAVRTRALNEQLIKTILEV